MRKKPYEPQKCAMCGKKRYTYKVHVDKGMTERWCSECINEETEVRFILKSIKTNAIAGQDQRGVK